MKKQGEWKGISLQYEANFVDNRGRSENHRCCLPFTLYEYFLSSYQGGDFSKIKMGNHIPNKIVGISDITIITNTGCKLMLKNIRHIPDMRLNLMSIGELNDVGLANYFGGGIWKLTKGSLIVARGEKEASVL